jgi:hypothetical protein
MMLSVRRRAARIALIGVRPQFLRLWQTAILVEIMSSHRNMRLPRHFARRRSPARQKRSENSVGGGR